MIIFFGNINRLVSFLPLSGNNFESSLPANYQVHQQSNQSNQSNQGCPVAGCKARNLSYQARVRVHWMEKHEPLVNMYKCCICNYKSKRRRNVDTHMFKMHQIHDGSHVSSGDEINTQYIDPGPYTLEDLTRMLVMGQTMQAKSDMQLTDG